MNKKKLTAFIVVLIVLLIIKLIQHQPHVESVETEITQRPLLSQVSSDNSTPDKVTNLPTAEVKSKPAEVKVLSPEDLETIKQMRSNAKANLASVYTALVSAQGEWGHYSTDLNAIGYAPNGNLMPFKLGFLSPYHPPIESSLNMGEPDQTTEFLTTDQFNNKIRSNSKEPTYYNDLADKIKLSDYAQYCKKECTATDNEFEVLLVLPLLDLQHVDVWTVNDRKEIIQVVDGLAEN
jgi:hypothetical protein